MMYTVVGYYSNTQLRYVSHFEADSPIDAVLALARLYPNKSISIVAVFEGELMNELEGDYPVDTEGLEEEYLDIE